MTMTFSVGQIFKPVGKHYTAVITDIYTTTNMDGVVIKVEYLSRYEFCGQQSTRLDCATTILRGIQNYHDSKDSPVSRLKSRSKSRKLAGSAGSR